ncbi:MAG TPA: PAS domain-containing protein [Dongiaceae bacterium]|jgi:hypothetical protein|nr:PAS domain-containing protein [Dongiaceae bacterium]
MAESNPPLAINEATGLAEMPASMDLRRLLAYWDRQRGGRPFPGRGDIDPIDLRFMLDRIALTEVHEDPRRYRLRLVGSFWHRLVGFEATGMWLDDWPRANQRAITAAFYEALIAGRVPRFTRRDAIVDDQLLSYEIMLLPLSEDGRRISMIITGIGQN